MKTPRELLLARHQEAEPKLDAIRRRAVTAAAGRPIRADSWWQQSRRTCAEFFRLPRLAVAGFAAAWLIIAALNFATSETAHGNQHVSRGHAPRSPEMLQALREQNRLLTELVRPANVPASALPPRPRSDRPPTTATA